MDKRRIWKPVSAAAALMGITGAAAGQNSWIIDVRYSDPAGVINSVDDTATINLWAAWDPAQYAFREATLDIRADDLLDAGQWSNPERLVNGPGSKDGTIQGESVVGIVPSQLHYPEAGIFADTSNPIKAWTATWQTFDLTPRGVRVDTKSVELWLYLPNGWGDSDGQSENFIDSLVEGSEVIIVVPAPSTLACLLPGVMLLSRRRRRT